MGPPPTLPVLPKHLASRKTEGRTNALFQLLRRIALSNRRAQTQTFYSLRHVAAHFAVPISLVSRVFALLEDEGLIGRIRGSRTVLHGRKYDRNLRVRGVVGLPVSIFRFSAFADHRAFNVEMRRQLRRHGFMPATIFFERHEIGSGFLTEHLVEAKCDTVIWFSPGHECREPVAALRDMGVRVIGVCDAADTSTPCHYEISRDKALRAILREWRIGGITSTVVVGEAESRSVRTEAQCQALSEMEKFPSETIVIKERQLKRMLGTFSRRPNRGILLTGSAAALCAVRAPHSLWELIQSRRVALVDGPIGLFFGHVPPVGVYLTMVDWRAVAYRIADDLVSSAVWERKESSVFHAEAQLGVSLDRICHEM